MDKSPNLFIVGAPKSGTTSMWHYLRQHPDIYMSEMKEPYYFCSDLSMRKISHDQYLSFFTSVKAESWIGEASTWYLYSRNAAREIRNYSENAKIIIMLRNPVDLLYSLHSQFLHTGYETIEEFGDALAAENERKKGRNIPPSCPLPEGLYYREVIKFTEQIERYFEAFDDDQVHIILMDDLKNDSKSVFGQVLEFLDVQPFIPKDMSSKNSNKTFGNMAVMRQMFNPSPFVYRLSKWLIPSSAARKYTRRMIKKLNTRNTSRAPLDATLRQDLKKEFHSEIKNLSSLLKRDLMYWVE